MKKERNNGRKASSEALMIPSADGELDSRGRRVVARRSFLKGLGMAGATLLPASALLTTKANAARGDRSGSLSRGDAAILRFLGAAEILESDLWEQYRELGGTQEEITNPTTGNALYTSALTILDGDMAQYIHDNTDDEFTHAAFIRAYLASKGASTAELDLLNGTHFRTLKGSTAAGSTGKLRLTNLLQLTVDTSFWTRYRSDLNNPDLDPSFMFGQAVKGLNVGQHPAIPKTDEDTEGSSVTTPPQNGITPHLQVIAFTAGFHFAFIEGGGTSLYPSLAQRVSDPEVLRILLSIGPTETMHFQTWQDKAGNALPVSSDGVTFDDLHATTDPLLQGNLIMPEPCPFLSRKFPICSIIRPTQTKGAAMGAAAALTADGLFIGQTDEFFDLIGDLARDADAAKREFEGEF
jgi:ferritin-like protein